MNELWSSNHPRRFWLLQPDPPELVWQEAIRLAIPCLELPIDSADVDSMLFLTLGEGQFGPERFQLSLNRQLYYQLKPLLPRALINVLKQANARFSRAEFPLKWPVEDRFARFQWELIRQLLTLTGETRMTFPHFWPNGNKFVLVLTHDVESSQGLANVRQVADMEEELGYRSSFNFVPERYELDHRLMQELGERGFEVGVHGLKHDGKLFHTFGRFMERASRINFHLRELGAVGFRAPLMHRNPEWLQALHVEYDLSFFDTDPYQPMPGGTMSIWPFILGRFVELPYTLVQDCTLNVVLGETTPKLWLQKVEFIERYYGMVLVNTHPDYLMDQDVLRIYKEFLQAMKQKVGYWHALPRDVARWWRERSKSTTMGVVNAKDLGKIVLENGQVRLC